MKKIGKRTNEWILAKAELKPRFQAAGITTCEFGYAGCWHDNALGFVHAVKRRKLSKDAKIGDPEHILTVALGCNICHDKAEYLPPEEMRDIVMTVIRNRKTQP